MECSGDSAAPLPIFRPPLNFPFMGYCFSQLPKISIDSASQTSYLSCVASCCHWPVQWKGFGWVTAKTPCLCSCQFSGTQTARTIGTGDPYQKKEDICASNVLPQERTWGIEIHKERSRRPNSGIQSFGLGNLSTRSAYCISNFDSKV